MRAARTRLEQITTQRGFTLTELLAAIAILGILIAIAIIILLGILEQRRVDAATKQLVSDMRLAHVNATNQLTDWRVVVVLESGGEQSGPDYYLARLQQPYEGEGDELPVFAQRAPKFFPGSVKAKNVITEAGSIVDDHTADYWIPPWESPPPEGTDTRTFEFNSNGTMKVYGAASGSVCVTEDNDPQNRVVSLSATSRLRVETDSLCDTSTGAT
ncbi:MAG: prepilin-type N-terminal cleavage/methylation domain-containing protein [Rubrobacteraceae bacterium]